VREDAVLGTATSKNGVRIRLTYKQWSHILEAHDYMAGNMDKILETISDPGYIAHGWADELIALKHYGRTSISEKYVVVVYKEDEEGFVITTFMTSNEDKILRRGVIWRK